MALINISMIITQKKTGDKIVHIDNRVELETPITTKGKDRYTYLATVNPIIIVAHVLKYLTQEVKIDIPTLISLLSDKHNNTFTSKEMCMLIEGIPATQYNIYVAAITLLEWLQKGHIELFREHDYPSHHARTVKSKKLKHISELVFKVVTLLVDMDFGDMYEALVMSIDAEMIAELEDKVRHKPKRNTQYLQVISDYWCDMTFRDNSPDVVKEYKVIKDRALQIMSLKRLIDKYDTKMEAALDLLTFLFPTISGGRRDNLIDMLYKYYVEHKCIENVTGIGERESGKLGRCKERVSRGVKMEVGLEGKHLYEILTSIQSIHPYNPLPISSLNHFHSSIPFSTSALVKAYETSLQSPIPLLTTYNTQAVKFLSSYEPSNTLEKRCKQVMIGANKAFPLYYSRLSECPRLYAEGKDNLFYCPTSMRHAVSNHLQLNEWDMRSCHTNILLGLFPNNFPILKGMIERNSIWKEYEEFFISKSCPFNKQVVKAFHYATILGGGKAAYTHSVKKLEKDGISITDDELNLYIKVFSSHPVVKEMKSFIYKWGYQNKEVTYPTGEVHKVKPTPFLTDPITGLKYRHYESSNTLQVFSGLLRAWEIILISYVGLSHPEAFTILLHQHDGITVKTHIPEAFQLAQEAMREISNICFPNLSKPIELEVKL